MTALFDTVIIVDWSASAKPSPARPSADAIWIGVMGVGETQPTYHRTRAQAEIALTGLLDSQVAKGRRVLLGFDFPLGYPQGFAQRLTGTPGARAVWNWMANHVTDGPDNANNRFQIAARINASFGGGGPFWGRPATLHLPHLSDRKTVDYTMLGFAERRRVETEVPRAQPTWKLFTTGSVGSQAIMGLPLIARLASRPDTAVWPFDPITDASLVIAEIYPSLIDPVVQRAVKGNEIKDSAQVRLLAQSLWQLGHDSAGLLPLINDVPDWRGRADEGWILGAGHGPRLLKALG